MQAHLVGGMDGLQRGGCGATHGKEPGWIRRRAAHRRGPRWACGSSFWQTRESTWHPRRAHRKLQLQAPRLAALPPRPREPRATKPTTPTSPPSPQAPRQAGAQARLPVHWTVCCATENSWLFCVAEFTPAPPRSRPPRQPPSRSAPSAPTPMHPPSLPVSVSPGLFASVKLAGHCRGSMAGMGCEQCGPHPSITNGGAWRRVLRARIDQRVLERIPKP